MLTPDIEALLADVERHDKTMIGGEWYSIRGEKSTFITSRECFPRDFWASVEGYDHWRDNIAAGIIHNRTAAPRLAALVREQAGEIERLKGIVNDFVKWFSPSCEKDLKVILNEARAFPYLAPPAAKEPS